VLPPAHCARTAGRNVALRWKRYMQCDFKKQELQMKIEQKQTIETFNKSAMQYETTIAQLQNYNQTYDFLIEKLNDGQTVLDLACGPANVSKYLLKEKKLNIIGYDLSDEMLRIAKINIPDGKFLNTSIINFNTEEKVELVLNGFGLPYLDKDQAISCLSKTYEVLKDDGLLYLSFMDGNICKLETPSFSATDKILIHYHQKDIIVKKLKNIGFNILKDWEINYKETDGSITKDIILIAIKSHSA